MAMPLASYAQSASEITAQERSRIMAAIAHLKCRINDQDIKKQNGGFVITDAFCADGQFAIRLNADFQVVDKRNE